MTERARKGSKGPLIIIGGGEDKEGRRVILREVAKHLDGGKLVLATVASHEPEGYFDEIIFREDPARRGRKPGEIVTLLAEGALSAGFPEERITRILDEDEAAKLCLQRAHPGDLVVLTPTDVEAMWRQVLDFRIPPESRFHVEVEQADGQGGSWRRRA